MTKPLHVPVLMEPLLKYFREYAEQNPDQKIRYFDGTFGRGGHLRAVLNAFPNCSAVAFDQDPEAIEFAKENFKDELASGRLEIFHKNFADFSPEVHGQFDLMLLDLGVSSPQLDQSQRGFSFYHDGPLDMRMDFSKGKTAADIVNSLSEDELNELFKELGEIRSPYRVTRAIVNDRIETPYKTTRELASLIERVEGWQKKGFHPATQFFMALRLEVNQELEVVRKSLTKLIHGLKPKARLAVLTFHSLEDRIVKNAFKDFNDLDLGAPLFKKVIQAERDEAKDNPRSRSAKLRIFGKYGPDDLLRMKEEAAKRAAYFKDEDEE